MGTRLKLLSISALLLSGLGALASEAVAAQQWPGGCKANYCMGQPVGSCGYSCVIGGPQPLCLTDSPLGGC